MKALNKILRDLILELLKLRNHKFLFLSKETSFYNLFTLLAYELSGKYEDVNNLLIKLVLEDLISIKILNKNALKYHFYELDNFIYHDVYLLTSDNLFMSRGTSVDKDEAYAKAFGEVFERTSGRYGDKYFEMIQRKISEIKKEDNIVDLNIFARPTKKQVETFPYMGLESNNDLTFVKVFNIMKNKFEFIPRQYVFFGKNKKYKEKTLLLPTTHGLGAGYTREQAFKSGMYEILHRHAFFYYWYRDLTPKRINPDTIPKNSLSYKKIKDLEKRNFKVHLMDFSGFIGLPTIICILEKYDGWYCGGGTKDSLESAISRSVDEAISIYMIYMRHNSSGQNKVTMNSMNQIGEDFLDTSATAYKKVLYFTNGYFVKNFKSTFTSGDFINYSEKYNLNSNFGLESLNCNIGKDLFIYNIQNEYLSKYEYFASKVIVPDVYYFAMDDIFSRPMLSDNFEPKNTKINPFP